MKAMLSRRIGGPETLALEDLPDPKPGAGEVLLAVKACGVNYPDVLIIDTSTADPFWAVHPMTRYPVLRAFLGEYRVETVIDGKTIYRRL